MRPTCSQTEDAQKLTLVTGAQKLTLVTGAYRKEEMGGGAGRVGERRDACCQATEEFLRSWPGK